MILLLVAGFGLLVTGLTAIAFGIPVKEFSFGNTLILCGTIVASTGALMLGMRAAASALRATVLGAPAATATAPQSNIPARRLPPLDPPVPDRAPGEGETFLFSRDRPSTERPDSSASASSPARTTERAETDRSAASAESGSPPPWRDEIARDRGRTRSAPPPRSAEPEPEPEPTAESEASAPSESTQKQRRNLLFASSRRERERAARAAQAGEAAAAGLPELPLLANEPRRTTFEEAWPETERARPEPLRARLFPGAEAHDPTAANEPAVPASDGPEAAPQVTVLKSGVVDGMAYSLYSDGSIEAEMPEGKMHFASIDELRSHLDQRS
ncbi:hypothetical protein HNR60_002550 [Rhodopseudomonas rhenobacensis]|uniref:DUF308 domain-containing protein n=1 Tax=Rhodopseudomonas rhenobacensis TaxID=87461 RepID=A0A7W8DZ97_9BRAD|nr:hypothetical protein [Rhodopseudomonas rhenobacensis]MBB5047793.1 hypothetical protein [Rhodopseudomonas rhenobacensis]